MKPWISKLSADYLKSVSNRHSNFNEIDSKIEVSNFPCVVYGCEKEYDDYSKTSGHIKTKHGIEPWLKYRLQEQG